MCVCVCVGVSMCSLIAYWTIVSSYEKRSIGGNEMDRAGVRLKRTHNSEKCKENMTTKDICDKPKNPPFFRYVCWIFHEKMRRTFCVVFVRSHLANFTSRHINKTHNILSRMWITRIHCAHFYSLGAQLHSSSHEWAPLCICTSFKVFYVYFRIDVFL